MGRDNRWGGAAVHELASLLDKGCNKSVQTHCTADGRGHIRRFVYQSAPRKVTAPRLVRDLHVMGADCVAVTAEPPRISIGYVRRTGMTRHF